MYMYMYMYAGGNIHLYMHACIYMYMHVYTCTCMCVVHMLMLLQVGAAFRPNPGQCGLVEKTEDGMTFAEYVEDTIYVSMTVYNVHCILY